MNLLFGQVPRRGMVVGAMPTFALVGALLIPSDLVPTQPSFSGSPIISEERGISVTEKEDLEAIKLFLVFLNSI